jgi:hypothetical protein
MQNEQSYKQILARIDNRATETFNLRLKPQVRLFLETEAEAQNISMTKIALSGFEMLYAAKYGLPAAEDWICR